MISGPGKFLRDKVMKVRAYLHKMKGFTEQKKLSESDIEEIHEIVDTIESATCSIEVMALGIEFAGHNPFLIDGATDLRSVCMAMRFTLDTNDHDTFREFNQLYGKMSSIVDQTFYVV